ncbi:MAG: hypothetical protein JW852_05880 [Spirochaetales bacterium]|nr:hypothetical protein [Spirochaetales bacterium]
MRALSFVLLILLVCGQLSAQTGTDTAASKNEQEEGGTGYEPYSEEEFPAWLHDLRRAEVVLIGSFPITMLFTSLGYQGIRAIINAATGVQTTGAPGIGGADFTPEERKGILITGTLLSVAVAVADYLIGLTGASDAE